MTPEERHRKLDEYRAFWRRSGVTVAIEFAVNLAMMIVLAVVTFEGPNGIGKVLATAAVMLIMILWTLGLRRRISRWKWDPSKQG